MMSIAYGLDIQREDDPYLQTATAVTEAIIHAVAPGQYLVVRVVAIFIFGSTSLLGCPPVVKAHSGMVPRRQIST